MGWQRARRAGSGPWASVLVVGSAGAFIPALAFHPLVPYAADKNLWYTSPMLLCLAAAAVWPIDRFDPSEPSSSPTRRTALAAGALVLLLGLVACSPDEDEDGWTLDAGDCDDSNPDVHPEAPELWQDGIDNDCDGLEDVSDDYVFVEEQEPNDTSLGSCFSPDGQDIGHLAGAGLLTRFSGRIDSVVDASYTEGDLDCIAFRVPEHVEHPRLYVTLSWLEEDSDLDLAVQGIWEGEQVAFGLSQAPGPSPEVLISSSGFDPTTPLWLWLAGYDGPPTDYELDLVLR